jgi:hypothetical protein
MLELEAAPSRQRAMPGVLANEALPRELRAEVKAIVESSADSPFVDDANVVALLDELARTHDRGHAVEQVAELKRSAKSYQNVEITDARGSPLGEIDEIVGDTIIEDKSAKGYATINPKTGEPYSTAEAWARKHLYAKSATRIENLERATKSRKAPPGAGEVPGTTRLREFRKLHFRVEEDAEDVRVAVERACADLRAQFPDWTFTASFGHSKGP